MSRDIFSIMQEISLLCEKYAIYDIQPDAHTSTISLESYTCTCVHGLYPPVMATRRRYSARYDATTRIISTTQGTDRPARTTRHGTTAQNQPHGDSGTGSGGGVVIDMQSRSRSDYILLAQVGLIVIGISPYGLKYTRSGVLDSTSMIDGSPYL